MLRDALYPYSSSTGRQVTSEDECQRSTGGGPGVAGSLDLQDPKGELV